MRWSRLRRRFWVDNALAIASGALAIATLVQPDWLEAVFGIDPDASSGALEWGLTVILAATSLAGGWLAGVEWRRAKGALPAPRAGVPRPPT
jgi:hypothetical protein